MIPEQVPEDIEDPDDGRPRWREPWMSSGFTQVPNVVLFDKELPGGVRLLYAIILSYAWDKERAWPGQDGLAESVGRDERTVRRMIQTLERVGLISVQRRGLGRTNIYWIESLGARYGAVSRVQSVRTPVSDQDRQHRSSVSTQRRSSVSSKEYTHEEYESSEGETTLPTVPTEPTVTTSPLRRTPHGGAKAAAPDDHGRVNQPTSKPERRSETAPTVAHRAEQELAAPRAAPDPARIVANKTFESPQGDTIAPDAPTLPVPSPNGHPRARNGGSARFAAVIDGIRGRGVAYVGTARDARAVVKDCADDPEEIAEAFVAAARGAWGGRGMLEHLSLWYVVGRMAAYRAWRDGVSAAGAGLSSEGLARLGERLEKERAWEW